MWGYYQLTTDGLTNPVIIQVLNEVQGMISRRLVEMGLTESDAKSLSVIPIRSDLRIDDKDLATINFWSEMFPDPDSLF